MPITAFSLQGCIIPMVTPVRYSNDNYKSLDITSLERVIAQIKTGGAAALFILGNAGAFQYIPQSDKLLLIETVIKLAASTPVVVGISDLKRQYTLELAQKAESAGAKALVLIPHFDGADVASLISDITSVSDLPIIFYNNPGICLNKSDITPEQISELNKKFNNRVVAIKESSGNQELFARFAKLQVEQGITVFQGDAKSIVYAKSLEAIIPGYKLMGAVPVHANLETAVYKNYLNGDSTLADALTEFVIKFPSIEATIAEMVQAGLITQESLDFWQSTHKA